MRRPGWLLALTVPFALALGFVPAADPTTKEIKAAPSDNTGIRWKKTVLDKTFRSEGVAVADVNKDGKIDVLIGEAWYEAPSWKRHEIQPLGNYGNGLSSYSHTFACWTEDLNGDSWPDLIVIDFPGTPCYWLENPQGKDGHWKKHIIWHSACNETPTYVDLLGNGKRVLVMGWQPKGKENEGQMAYFTPAKDPTELWQMHPISEPSTAGHVIPGTFKFSHGLGIGDINGDGKLDVICTEGWWEQPSEASDKAWKFHRAPLVEPCADMFAYDVDGDGKADVLSSSAHHYGIWSYLQRPGQGEDPTFLKKDLFPKLVSETHAMHCVDINGDGHKDLVTGKRFWSHGRSEPGSDQPARVYWFEARKRGGVTRFIPHEIDDDSGIGTQFAVSDVNGDKLLDVITANKKGVFLFEQVRASRAESEGNR